MLWFLILFFNALDMFSQKQKKGARESILKTWVLSM